MALARKHEGSVRQETKTKSSTPVTSEAAFLEERRGGIGGTDASVIVGLSKYKTPLQLFFEKRGELPDLGGLRNPDQVQWGKLLEEPIRRRYRKETGRVVQRAPFIRHATYPFLVGHPDGFTWKKPAGKGVLEIKTAFFTELRQWAKNGIPEQYYLQVQHYMMVAGVEWASFAVLFGGSRFEHFDIGKDEEICKALMRVELEFWDRVQTGSAPGPTYDAMGSELAGIIYPRDVDRSVVLDGPVAAGKAKRLLAIKERIKKWEKEKVALEAFFKFEIGMSKKAIVPFVAEMTWAGFQRSVVDMDKLKREYFEVFQQTVSVKDSRRFSFRKQADVEEEAAEIERAEEAGAVIAKRPTRAIDLEV